MAQFEIPIFKVISKDPNFKIVIGEEATNCHWVDSVKKHLEGDNIQKYWLLNFDAIKADDKVLTKRGY